QNFFMVIPVVSTTFYSFDKMLATSEHNEIPWLFIDAAGRYRHNTQLVLFTNQKKVVVVGDLLQTDPISILKQDLMNKLCEHFKVSYPEWSPSEVSLQNLADRNSLYQTKIDDVTVGFPLLVHRRCQNPMFKICNKIAYGDKMIFATSDCNSDIRTILGTSKWIDIKDNKVQRYKYESEAEFQKLELLKQVLKEKNGDDLLKQIYIITMYKDYSSIRRKLNKIYDDSRYEKTIQAFGYKNIGTIHAFQGKENDTVIILLGAQHPLDKGARNIMTKKPNVLNVGISRAKNNLYIIGSLEIWLKHKYMPEIYNMLGDKDYT
ncbi:MAG: DEAD/DEAH box helicase, partial [Rickettsia conorii subsp. raoultii]